MSQTKTSLMGQCISEFIGTALLVFFGLGCVAAARIAGAQLGLWEISIIWGLGVALAVYLTAGTSGAHLNPAVTVAFWLFACFERKKVIPYIVAQMLGGFLPPLLCTLCITIYLSTTNRSTELYEDHKKASLLRASSLLTQQPKSL